MPDEFLMWSFRSWRKQCLFICRTKKKNDMAKPWPRRVFPYEYLRKFRCRVCPHSDQRQRVTAGGRRGADQASLASQCSGRVDFFAASGRRSDYWRTATAPAARAPGECVERCGHARQQQGAPVRTLEGTNRLLQLRWIRPCASRRE